MPTLGGHKAPKWSPRGSQDGAKKEKKNEVKSREVKSAKKKTEGERVAGCYEAAGGVRGDKTGQDRPERLQEWDRPQRPLDRPKTANTGSNTTSRGSPGSRPGRHRKIPSNTSKMTLRS